MTIDANGAELVKPEIQSPPEDVGSWSPAYIYKAPESEMPKFDHVGEVWGIKQICAALSRPLPADKTDTKPKGGNQITFIPWYKACSLLERYAPGWEYDVDVVPMADRVIVKATITIHAKDGTFKRSSTGEETLKEMDSKGVAKVDKNGNTKEHPYGSPATNAEGQALRRAASKFGLGLYLYSQNKKN